VISVDDPRGLRRCRTFISELAANGIDDVPFEILPAPATLQGGREGLRRMFANGSPEIVFCSSDTLAQGVLAEAASRGLSVPADIAVMGFGDLSSAAHVYPALSTVRVDGTMIGTRAAQALLERFKAPTSDKTGLRIDTGFSIVERDSA
jgi:LacI family transcriptional regulator, gluconate utilization system Gnt-I transcriptional repressor